MSLRRAQRRVPKGMHLKRILRILWTLRLLLVRGRGSLHRWLSSTVLLPWRERKCVQNSDLFLVVVFHLSHNQIISVLLLFDLVVRWYAWWEKAGFFVADAKSSKPKFVIVRPLVLFLRKKLKGFFNHVIDYVGSSSSKCDWSLAYWPCLDNCNSGFINIH